MTCVPVLWLWHAEDEKAKVFPECPFLQPFPSNLLMEGSVKSISTNQRELVGFKFYFPKPENS